MGKLYDFLNTLVSKVNASAAGCTTEPAEDDIPKVFFGAPLPQTKLYAKMSFRYVSKTTDIRGYCHTKAQGNYSMRFPKKNQTVKLYKDADCTQKLKIGFKDWGEQSKFCFKANYIDPTHARNIVCANLWDEVVSSRADYDTLPEEMRNSPRNGAVDGFPVKLYADGIYQGVYTLNIPKDDWMWNMDDDNPNHILMCAETNTNGVYAETPCNFRALWDGTDGSYWSVEVGENSETVKNSLNALISCVKDTDNATFKAAIDTYLDVQSAIDYYIFQYVINGTDGLGKNMLLATYDGVKWHCGAYDMDGVFFPPVDNPCPDGYGEQFSLLWERITITYGSELSARYAELRQSVLSFGNIIAKLEGFTCRIGTELYEQDREIFPELPTGDNYDVECIREYIHGRLAYCDSQIARVDEPMYTLAEEITTSRNPWYYEDTGIKLFEEQKSFTLICEVTMDALPSDGDVSYIWSCGNLHDASIGDNVEGRAYFAAQVSSDGIGFIGKQDTWGNWLFLNNDGSAFKINSTYSKIAIVVTEGVPTALYYTTEKDSEKIQKPYKISDGLEYRQHDGTLYLGGYYETWGVDRLFDGTFNTFKIWDYAMTENDVYNEFGIVRQAQMLYQLPEEKVVDTTAWTGHLNTGIKLFNEPKSFTLFCEVTLDDDCPDTGTVWSCTNHYASPADGNNAYFQAKKNPNVGLYITGVPGGWGAGIFGDHANNPAIPSSYSKHAIVVTNGVPTALYYATVQGGTIQHMNPVSGLYYIQHEGELILGATQYSYGLDHLMDGTIHAFEIWDYAMTADEAKARLEAL